MEDHVAPTPNAPPPDEPEVEEQATPIPALPPEVTAGDDELRRLIEAGASTPEELRDLAARIREHRDREDTLWRDEVRPALKKAKKGRFRLADLVDRPEGQPVQNLGFYLIGLFGVVLVLVLAATRSSVFWVLLPLVAVLVYAFVQGKRGHQAEGVPPAAEDAPD